MLGGLTVIVYNPDNPMAEELSCAMCARLEELGYTVVRCGVHEAALPPLPGRLDAARDFAVSLGGDGTFLSCARKLADNPIPILPVHLGTLGFITEITRFEWQEVLDSWLAGELGVEQRMIIGVEVFRDGRMAARYRAVNDAVVSAGGISKMVQLSLELGDSEGGVLRGDGMILATATGSTAYSMAAGGPIIVPPMEALVLTPVCPFSLSWRPMVIPGSEKVILRLTPNQRADVQLTVDGQELFPLQEGDEVRMHGLPGGMQVIKCRKRMFYEVVRSKLGWSGGPNA